MPDDQRRGPIDRRSSFVERLSIVLVVGALFGGGLVLLDIKATFTFWGQVIQIGVSGFSQDTKGMVLQSILIGGFAAAVQFWLGSTKQGQETAQSVQRIAEAAPQVAAAASTAATAAAAATAAVTTPKDEPPKQP